MHDCPRCKVPLHGHEEFCPSCGQKQVVRKEFRDIHVPQTPPVNIVPFVVAAVLFIGAAIFAAQSSWIGQVMKGPAPEDPMEKMTVPQARQLLESTLTQGLQAVSAPVKITYTVDEKPVTAAVQTPVNMTVETTLADPSQRKAIIDPAKQYMEKAWVPSLVMKDSKSKATWTYTVSIDTTPKRDEAAELLNGHGGAAANTGTVPAPPAGTQ